MEPVTKWRPAFSPEDGVWVLLFSAMIVLSPQPSPAERAFVLCLGVLQVIEPKIPFFTTRRGILTSVAVKLVLSYLVMWFPGEGSIGIRSLNSNYYLILLLPIVTAATSLGVVGTLVATVVAGLAYWSFWLVARLAWGEVQFENPSDRKVLGLRLVFLALAGYLTHRLAEANRRAAREYQALAEQFARANVSLQEAEAAVRRSERLAALGQLSAGLAHELRNPLGTVKASSEMLARNLTGENEVVRELAGFISAEVDRVNSLITRFLDFARPLELRPAAADLSEVIDRAVSQLERLSPRPQVTVYKNYSPDIAPFALDAELIERVIYNLLVNAAQATPPGGVVTVKTRQVDSSVEVAVIDRGSGIDPAHREAIFNPFFTTKTEGVGLGLAIVSKIVDQHGGRITVESEKGKGSIFRVYLPIARESR